jgi:hypothetical protein
LRIDRYNYKKKLLPPEIRAAKKKLAAFHTLVRLYETAEENIRESARKKRDREIALIRKEVFFGTPESALRMLEALQRKNSNRT